MGTFLKCLSWSAAERYAAAARTVVHLIVGPAATSGASSCHHPAARGCGRGIRSTAAPCGCLLRGRGGDTAGREEPRNFGLHRDKQLAVVRQRAEIIQLPPATPHWPTGPGCC